jgi:hypothetical protein
MTSHDEIEHTAARLRAALSRAADVMVVPDTYERQPVRQVQRARRAGGWLFPLAAAASVAVVVLASVTVAHLTGSGGTRTATGTPAQVPRPEFYMTASYSVSGPDDLRFQVRRSSDGAVTGSMTISAVNLGWGGEITTGASDRTFYFGHYPCLTTGVAVTTFSRITITGSGRITGMTAGPRFQGMVTSMAVSPDGSRIAYGALPGHCVGGGFKSAAAGAVNIMDLSTGAVRTWQDPTGEDIVEGLSWAPDGRTLVVDERSRMLTGPRLTVYRLDAASGGGSLGASSTTLLQQSASCSTCVTAAVAGPDNSLTTLEVQKTGQRPRLLVVSIPSATGSPRTVLYSQQSDTSGALGFGGTELLADSSGQWLLLWPTVGLSGPHGQRVAIPVGWIAGGQLHPLPGVGQVFPQGVAW